MVRAAALGRRVLRRLEVGVLARGSPRSCGGVPAPRQRWRFGTVAVGAGASALVLAWASRKYLDHLRVQDLQASVHHGNNSARLASARRQLDDEGGVVVSFTAADGQQSTMVVDKGELASATTRRAEALAAAEKSLRQAASAKLSAELDLCFGPIGQRASNFADWYFAYPTTIKLVREAATSAARHSADMSRTTPLKTAIAMDLDDVLMQKYEHIVLQPELNNAKLQEAFLNTAKDLHQRFCRDIRDLDDQLLRELAKRTSHLEEPSHDAVHLTLDWSSQRHKVKAVPAQFEKMPELSLALGVGGAVAAKAAGASLSSKVAGAAAGKVVCSKLTAPFALKALGGTAVAGLLAGPVGGAVGLAAGVGADVALHRGLELLQRKDFEAEVLRAVRATRDEYFQTLEAELHRALGAWMADARHLAYTSPAAAE